MESAAEIPVDGPGAEASAVVELEAGREYWLVNDFDYTTAVPLPTSEREHCYEWVMKIRQNGKTRTVQCPALRSRSAKNWASTTRTGSRRACTNCVLPDCTFRVAKSGKTRISVSLEETQACPSGVPEFSVDLRFQHLAIKVAADKRAN